MAPGRRRRDSLREDVAAQGNGTSCVAQPAILARFAIAIVVSFSPVKLAPPLWPKTRPHIDTANLPIARTAMLAETSSASGGRVGLARLLGTFVPEDMTVHGPTDAKHAPEVGG